MPIHPDEDHTWPAATRPAGTITSVVSQLRLPGALGRAGRQYLRVADLRECDMPSFELSFAPRPTPPARDGGGGTGGVSPTAPAPVVTPHEPALHPAPPRRGSALRSWRRR